jgi:predicted outer membrane repeat protein
MKKQFVTLTVLILALWEIPLLARVIHVPDDSVTIQGAIDGATDGDTVLVHPGTYTENINYDGKEIVVGSLFLTTQDEVYIAGTVVDKAQDGPVVTFTDYIGPNAVLAGFSITNSSDVYIGNMIACLQSSPTLTGLNISGSVYSSTVDGGGLWCMNYSSPILTDVRIAENEAARGGGIFCYLYSNPSLTNVIISGNSAEYGGGIYAGNDIYPILTNVTVSGNTADVGGGARFYSNSNPTLLNSIFWNNSPSEIDMFDEFFNSTLTVSYCDVRGGEDGIVTNGNFTGTILWLDGNIDAHPSFVPFPFRGFNLLLLPVSPCIDAGDPLLGDGFNWPDWYSNGERSDMGAYGGTGNIGWLTSLQFPPFYLIYLYDGLEQYFSL